MKKASIAFLLSVFMLCACSKPVQEEQNTIRLPAETAEAEEKKTYVYLEKTDLRNEDVISKPYFFKDCSVDGNEAEYCRYGITALLNLQTAEDTTPSSLLEENKDTALSEIGSWEYTLHEITGTQNCCMTYLSYIKEVKEKQKKEVITYRYPCIYLIAVETLADGSYLLITLNVDNELSEERTEDLLTEFLDAYSITFQ